MTPDFTLIWPLSCLKDGVHLSRDFCPLEIGIRGNKKGRYGTLFHRCGLPTKGSWA